MAADPRFVHVRTERLVLGVPGAADVDELLALNADPRIWTVLPARHAERSWTQEWVDVQQRRWDADGLAFWTMRPAGGAGPLLGVGGCDLRHGTAWNLGYRLAVDAWGHGYAQEVVAAARAAAATVRDLPMTAYLFARNARSRAATERTGLRLVWRGPDAHAPTEERLVYADRDLDDATLRTIVAAD